MQSLPITINLVKVTRRYDRYNAKAARILGALQLSLGVASIVLNAFVMIYAVTGFFFTGYGFWFPVFWFISGAFGIAASFRKTKCLIITTMVMSILSATFMAIYICLASFQMVAVSNDCDYDCGSTIDYIVCNEICQYAIGALVLVVAVAETTVAIVTVVLCCRAVCCHPPYTTFQEHGAQNLVVTTPSGAQTVSIPTGYQDTNQDTPDQNVVDNRRNNEELVEDKPDIPPPYTVATGY